jgi:hypothetical protein
MVNNSIRKEEKMKCTCGKGGKCNCGGMAKKPVKMNKGGYCGASNPAARPIKKGK